MAAQSRNKDNILVSLSGKFQKSIFEIVDTNSEDVDDFVQISLSSSDLLDNSCSSSKSDKTIQDRNCALIEAEVESEAKEETTEGTASLESSTGDLGDVDLDELLEIEKQIPDHIEDIDPPIAPKRPATPFQEEYSPSSHQRPERAPTYPPGLGFGPENCPPPQSFNPAPQGAGFAGSANDDTEDEEDGEVREYIGIREDDGNGDGRICWSEAFVTIAEWELSTDPNLGRYRVRHLTNLLYCWTIVRGL